MKSKKKVIYPVGYQPVSFLSGYYKEKNKQWFYFTDPSTTQQIKFFDLQGNLKDSVSLKEVVKKNNELTDIHIFSLDTIVITSRYINKISVLNRKGEVWKEYDLKNSIIDNEKNKYWLWGSLNNSQQNKENLLYITEWRSNLRDEKEGKTPLEKGTYNKYFNENSYDSFILCRVEGLFSNDLKVTFGFKNFHHYISKSPYYIFGHTFFTRAKNKVYIFGPFSNYILVIDINSLQLVEKIKLTSSYTTIGMEPAVNQKLLRNRNKIARKKGVIQKVLFNDKKNEFYVILTKDIEREKEEGAFRPFVIQRYNENFILIGEKEFEAGKYSPFKAYVVEGKLMLYKKNTNINSLKNGEQIFEFFTFK